MRRISRIYFYRVTKKLRGAREIPPASSTIQQIRLITIKIKDRFKEQKQPSEVFCKKRCY